MDALICFGTRTPIPMTLVEGTDWGDRKDANLRSVALGKFENLPNGELAARLDCTVATVGRRLTLIRGISAQELTDD